MKIPDKPELRRLCSWGGVFTPPHLFSIHRCRITLVVSYNDMIRNNLEIQFFLKENRHDKEIQGDTGQEEREELNRIVTKENHKIVNNSNLT